VELSKRFASIEGAPDEFEIWLEANKLSEAKNAVIVDGEDAGFGGGRGGSGRIPRFG
jgi:hypothetical protein